MHSWEKAEGVEVIIQFICNIVVLTLCRRVDISVGPYIQLVSAALHKILKDLPSDKLELLCVHFGCIIAILFLLLNII